MGEFDNSPAWAAARLLQAVRDHNRERFEKPGALLPMRITVTSTAHSLPVVARITDGSTIEREDVQFILDTADELGGKVSFLETGEINVSFT